MGGAVAMFRMVGAQIAPDQLGTMMVAAIFSCFSFWSTLGIKFHGGQMYGRPRCVQG